MDTIMEKMKKETDKEIEKILANYAEKEAKTISDSKEQAEMRRKEILEFAEKKAATEQKRLVSAATLEARKKKLDVIDGILESWIGKAEEDIPGLRKEKDYNKTIVALARKAVLEIPSNSVLVLALKEDKEKLRSVKAKGKKLSFRESKELKTGVIIRANDNSVEINASFSNLLENSKSEIKKELLELIEK